jgi:hypothetical protein
MYVCIYIYMYIYKYIYIYVYMYVYSTNIYIYIYLHIFDIYTQKQNHTHNHTHTHTHTYAAVRWACLKECVFTTFTAPPPLPAAQGWEGGGGRWLKGVVVGLEESGMHTHTRTHTYTHTHTHTRRGRGRWLDRSTTATRMLARFCWRLRRCLCHTHIPYTSHTLVAEDLIHV